ncbi:MAG: lipoprotein signal peptidase [Bacteroidetes bacterium]|jgi:signal peptidase II|nr:lipoprotein signal peptidase [Bacteroidota bacterium]
MNIKLSKGQLSILLIIGVLIIDQASKIWIKTNMSFSDTYFVFGDWFLIKFIENPGMAFGIDIPGQFGKLILSIFRIIAVIGISWYMYQLIKQNTPSGVILCIAAILAGALGNIIDSVFYGLIFSDTTYTQVAEIFPENGGYATLMHGRVVDMLYFPIIEGYYPEWIPIWGGKDFEFFRPIFNVADTSISVGVLTMLIFQRKHLKDL